MTAGGNSITIRKKLAGMIMAAYIPNDLIGICGLKTLARKATAVVPDVIAMALTARLHA